MNTNATLAKLIAETLSDIDLDKMSKFVPQTKDDCANRGSDYWWENEWTLNLDEDEIEAWTLALNLANADISEALSIDIIVQDADHAKRCGGVISVTVYGENYGNDWHEIDW